MGETLPVVVDADDLWCKEQIEDLIVPIKNQVPDFRITLYAIPNRLGPVHDLKRQYPWITFGIHGWEHTFCECLSWSQTQAEYFINQALEMGYDSVFKAPNWQLDEETELALRTAGVVLHHHQNEYTPKTKGLRVYPGTTEMQPKLTPHVYIHTHIVRNPSTDFITDHAEFTPERLQQWPMFRPTTFFAEELNG